ncbi:acyltransferase family protein [Butyrivibrio sp. AC2005]|uniref:acyltransferase family protein n=1 Tax=Butyrivibrio sp. AC2005 TaxID=1280672 RepID=UPI00047EF9BE|nr:acyltransferase family protein [Butyrivibrio sp. AC2005]
MQYAVLYIIVLLVIIPGVEFKHIGLEGVVPVQKNVNNLRGLFAILIIFTHCTLAYNNLPQLLLPFKKLSTFGVGFFFVLSGYGVAFSYNSKDNYLENIMTKKSRG